MIERRNFLGHCLSAVGVGLASAVAFVSGRRTDAQPEKQPDKAKKRKGYTGVVRHVTDFKIKNECTLTFVTVDMYYEDGLLVEVRVADGDSTKEK